MKKFTLSRLWILLVFVSGAVLAQDQKNTGCFYGNWQFESMNGTPIEGMMTYKMDNTVTVTYQGESRTEKFVIKGNDIMVTTNGVESKATIKSCDATTLELYDESGQATFVMKRASARPAVEVVSAIYGRDDKTADVSKKLQELINNGECNIWVRNHILGVDPIKGVQKRLTVVYKVNGVQKEAAVTERGYLDICELVAVSKPVVKIVSASYGNGDRTADVSKKLQELIDKGECDILVRNHILGADPAPGVQKHLKVVYTIDGVEKEESIAERGYLKVCPK